MARTHDVGERSLLIDADRPVSAASWLRTAAATAGILLTDVVPAARTVLISASSSTALAALRRIAGELPNDLDDAEDAGNGPVQIAVRFDGPDLDAVATHAGLPPDGLVRLLLDTAYVVDFCGFAPGFAYLAGLPERLHVPRRAEPRTRVPAGSFALAGEYAAVYPRESPGGWQLVATTDEVMFDVDRDPPALLVAGTRVSLRAAGRGATEA